MRKIRELIFAIFNKLNLKLAVKSLLTSLTIVTTLLIMAQFTSILKLLNLQHAAIIIMNAGLLICIIIAVLLFLFFSFMFKCINDITQYTRVLSAGKLNVNDAQIQGNNDLSMLAEYINNLKANLLFLLDQTKENVLVLSESIETVSNNMDEVLAENEQVSSEMQEISSKSQEQLNVLSDTIAQTDEVRKSTDIINIDIKKVEIMSSDANSAAAAGKESLNVYNQNIDLISGSIKNTNEFIKELKANASEISSVVNFIVGLSKQLKLLSLNASIQAERAGEVGKGFNVVAHEITELSDSTQDSIDKINTIVANILNGSNKVEESTEKSIEYFKKSKNIFSKVEKTFNEISEKNSSVLKQINDVVSEALNIDSNIKNTVMLCEKINTSSVVVSQSTDEIVSSIEQELEEFQGINSSISGLHFQLRKIEGLIKKFEIDIKPIEDNPKKQLKIAMLLPQLGGVWDIIKFGALYGKKILKSKNTIVEMININNAMSEEEYVDIIMNCIKNRYDGIVTPGLFEEKLQQVIEANIPVITYNMDIKNKSKRAVYVGENSYEAGITAGKTMSRQIGGSGRLLIITSDVHLENFKLREDGIKKAIQGNKDIEIVGRLEIPLGDKNAYEIVKKYLSKNSEIDGIIHLTAGVVGLARAIEEANKSNNLKTIVFFDNIEKILSYINSGTITCAIGQDPFRQGYDSLIYMYNYLVNRQKPEARRAFTQVKVMDINKAKNFLG